MEGKGGWLGIWKGRSFVGDKWRRKRQRPFPLKAKPLLLDETDREGFGLGVLDKWRDIGASMGWFCGFSNHAGHERCGGLCVRFQFAREYSVWSACEPVWWGLSYFPPSVVVGVFWKFSGIGVVFFFFKCFMRYSKWEYPLKN